MTELILKSTGTNLIKLYLPDHLVTDIEQIPCRLKKAVFEVAESIVLDLFLFILEGRTAQQNRRKLGLV